MPRVGQSIHLLQMSHLELATAIEKELQDNPLLEVDEASIEPEDGLDEPAEAPEFLDMDEDEAESLRSEELLAQTPSELKVEVGAYERLAPDESIEAEIEWDDRLKHLTPTLDTTETDSSAFLENHAKSASLTDHLLEQLRLSNCTEIEAHIAELVFEYLNEDGFIELSGDDLLVEVQRFVACTSEDLDDVLALVQEFSPLGVCARNLRECLMIQTRSLARTDPRVPTAMRLLRDAFDVLVSRDLHSLAQMLNLQREQLDDVLAFIEHLNPRPASSFARENIDYLTAEARIHKVDDEWQVEMLEDYLPTLKISDWYMEYRRSFGRASRRDHRDSNVTHEREFLKECHGRAKLFLSSLRYRKFNVMRILSVVVAKQHAFFEHGESAMQPLLLSDVAAELGLHNSTVSRLTTGKYLETPRGLFELKYFFTNRVGTQPGKVHSGMAIRSVLKNLIKDEDPRRPLSDQEISAKLKRRNIEISRRTVTKYRESLDIPASKERRQVG